MAMGCKPIDNGDGSHSVVLTRGYVALVDSEDAELISRFTWIADVRSEHQVYALAQAEHGKGSGKVRMHRLVMGCVKGDGKVVDHVSHIGTDNRKSNLRICTQQDNCRNQRPLRRRYKGVFCENGRYRASIVVDKREVYLGTFVDAVNAAAAYNNAAQKYFGEFACLNDVPAIERPRRLVNTQSGYRGVYWNQANKKWAAVYHGKHIGLFSYAIDAAIAYDKVAAQYGRVTNEQLGLYRPSRGTCIPVEAAS